MVPRKIEIYGGLREEIGMKTCLHGPMDYAKTLKLPERRKRHASSWEEEDVQMCPCGKAVESRTHIVGEFEIYKEERDAVAEERRKMDKCGMGKFGTLLIRSRY